MTDDFVTKAFSDAEMLIAEKEFSAYCNKILDDVTGDAAHLSAAIRVGLDKMEILCKAVFEGDASEILASYAHNLMIVGFHLGYRAALEEKL